jgi:hypothetical protein
MPNSYSFAQIILEQLHAQLQLYEADAAAPQL